MRENAEFIPEPFDHKNTRKGPEIVRFQDLIYLQTQAEAKKALEENKRGGINRTGKHSATDLTKEWFENAARRKVHPLHSTNLRVRCAYSTNPLRYNKQLLVTALAFTFFADIIHKDARKLHSA